MKLTTRPRRAEPARRKFAEVGRTLRRTLLAPMAGLTGALTTALTATGTFGVCLVAGEPAAHADSGLAMAGSISTPGGLESLHLRAWLDLLTWHGPTGGGGGTGTAGLLSGVAARAASGKGTKRAANAGPDKGAPISIFPEFKPSLHTSFLARDWGGTFALQGETNALDRARLSQSTQMLVARTSWGEGRIVPYSELGLGNWRVNPALYGNLREDREYATEIALGFAVPISADVAFAWQASGIMLCRDQREPQNRPTPYLAETAMAFHAKF